MGRFVKFIYPSGVNVNGKVTCTVDVLEGYGRNQTLGYYEGLIAELKKVFPDLDPQQVSVGKVYASDIYNRFNIISAQIDIPEADLERESTSWFGKKLTGFVILDRTSHADYAY